MKANEASISSGSPVYKPVADNENKSPANSNKSFFKGILSGLNFMGYFRAASTEPSKQEEANQVASKFPVTTESLNQPSSGSPPKLSLSQRIRSLFFGSLTTESSSAEATKGTGLLSWFSSKMFGSKPAAQPEGILTSDSSSNPKGTKDQRPTSVQFADKGDSILPRKITLSGFQINFDKPVHGQTPKDCSKTIPEEGSWTFSTRNQLAIIDQEVQKLQQQEDTTSFDNDVQRTFSVACENGTSTVNLPGETLEQQASRKVTAHAVLSEVSNHLFPALEDGTNSPQASKLHDELHKLNPQGLIGCALKVLSTNDVPEGALSLLGGFTGTLTYAPRNPPREITLTAKGNLKGNALRGKLNGLDTTLFSEDYKWTGTIEVIIKAQINDDGSIASLSNLSAEGSYQLVQ